ncbi:glycosyl transferase family 1 [bacterium]|nr:glycosyl transferase family 1 [bacterium]
MNRVVVFSHFDKDNLIQDYVVYYLSKLKKIVGKIIFVSDCNVIDSELNKIRPYISNAIIGKHGEYDFGSYKRGYNFLLNNNLLNDCEELIFANDSCYAPLFPFENMFQEMEQRNVDFWGNTTNHSPTFGNIKHIQSYFIVFKPKVFSSDCFKNFILSVKKEETKEDIILNYECELTNTLNKSGFSWDVYCGLSKKYCDTQVIFFKELIKQNKSSFLKRNIPALQSKVGKMFFNINKFIKENTDYQYNIEYQELNIEGFIKYFIKKYIIRRTF